MITAFILAAGCSRSESGPKVTLTSDSPGGSFRVEIHEFLDRMDRNFEVKVIDRKGSSPASTVFSSPDEGRPPGERIIWNADGNAFLIVSKSVSVDQIIETPAGERLYLLYAIKDRQVWCNASQVTMKRFERGDVSKLGIELPNR